MKQMLSVFTLTAKVKHAYGMSPVSIEKYKIKKNSLTPQLQAKPLQ